MADDRTIDENADTNVDSDRVARPNFTQPLDAETQPRPAGAVVIKRAKIGRFRIDAELGSGGMADVFRAYDPTLDREVALKVLRGKPWGDDSRRVERVLREARAAAALTHPNLVTIYEVGEADGEAFIAMELLHGKALREVVALGGATLEQKLTWLLQAARALAAAHARGLVHRDVKPENMFVCTDGTLKLLDFGIAKRESDTNESGESNDTGPSSLRTEAGRRLGTPRYMAPEQHAARPTDARTDEYAWGLVAFELLSGVHATSDSATSDADEGSVLTAPAVRAAALLAKAPDVPPEIVALLTRATEPRQSDRFTSMAPIIEVLERRGTRSVPAVTQSQPKARGIPSGTKWLVAAALVISVLALLLGISLERAARTTKASSAQALVANRAAPMCHVTQTRTRTHRPHEILLPRSDGSIATVRNDASGLSVETESTDGGAPVPILPFTIPPEPGHQLEVLDLEPLSMRDQAALFFGFRNISTAGTLVVVGTKSVRGTRRTNFSPSHFAAVAFGDGVVGAVATNLGGGGTLSLWVLTGGVDAHGVDVEIGDISWLSMAATKTRFGIAYLINRQLHFALYGEGNQRFGDVITAVPNVTSAPALVFADEGKSAVIYFSQLVDRRCRLYLASLTLGETAFKPAAIAIDDPLVDRTPVVASLPGGESIVIWLKTTGGAITLRASPVGNAGTLVGPTNLATGDTFSDLHAVGTARGFTVAWDNGANVTTLEDVECQPPAVSTPAR